MGYRLIKAVRDTRPGAEVLGEVVAALRGGARVRYSTALPHLLLFIIFLSFKVFDVEIIGRHFGLPSDVFVTDILAVRECTAALWSVRIVNLVPVSCG